MIKEEKLIDQVRDIIGDEAHAALLSALGGARIVVPKKIGQHHPIYQAIGAEASARLSEEIPGTTIDLPVTAKKRALIAAALKENKSAFTIAKSYFCSVRFVYKVQSEMRSAPEPRQMGLF